MYYIYKKESKYQFFCPDCGYLRDGLLDKPDYSWSCPKCGRGHYSYEEIDIN